MPELIAETASEYLPVTAESHPRRIVATAFQ
jgi:hypothetical protein